jgi:hypothetical protein
VGGAGEGLALYVALALKCSCLVEELYFSQMYVASSSWMHNPSEAMVDKQADARWGVTRFSHDEKEWHPTLPNGKPQ